MYNFIIHSQPDKNFINIKTKKMKKSKNKAKKSAFHQHSVSGSSDMIPAIPPEDYKGSIADWMITLQERGHWDGDGWYGDIEIPSDEWWSILEQCEGDE